MHDSPVTRHSDRRRHRAERLKGHPREGGEGRADPCSESVGLPGRLDRFARPRYSVRAPGALTPPAVRVAAAATVRRQGVGRTPAITVRRPATGSPSPLAHRLHVPGVREPLRCPRARSEEHGCQQWLSSKRSLIVAEVNGRSCSWSVSNVVTSTAVSGMTHSVSFRLVKRGFTRFNRTANSLSSCSICRHSLVCRKFE